MVAMLDSTEVDGKKISQLVDEEKISKAKLDEIVERTKNGGAEIVKYLEKDQLITLRQHQALKWLKVI